MHGSLLPRYRGRVPVNWAVIKGERETGATLHYMVEKPDAGDIVAQQAVPILPDDTAFDVFSKVTVAAEMRARPRAAGAARRHRAAHAAGSEPRLLLRRTQARGRTHRLAAAARRRSTIWCAASPRPTPARSATWPGKRVRVLRTPAARASSRGAVGFPALYLPRRALLRGMRRRQRCCASCPWKWTVQCSTSAASSAPAPRRPVRLLNSTDRPRP